MVKASNGMGEGHTGLLGALFLLRSHLVCALLAQLLLLGVLQTASHLHAGLDQTLLGATSYSSSCAVPRCAWCEGL